MPYLLQVDFPYNGPWDNEMTLKMTDLAQSIAHESGLIWKIWTENKTTKEAGGVYLFDTMENASMYLTMHTKRLVSFGIPQVQSKIFAVNQTLSEITKMVF